MKVAIFDIHKFERPLFEALNKSFQHNLVFFELRLTSETAYLAKDFPAVCSFVNDKINAKTLNILKENGCQLLALRTAGFNHVDLQAAKKEGIRVVRVPVYSPYAVAEHAIALLLALNRKLCRASARVHELNFSLDGLVGYDLHGKVAGIVGTGRIGSVTAKILSGFGCEVLAFDKNENTELKKQGIRYVTLEELFLRSDIISLHVPLNSETLYLINVDTIAKMRRGGTLINTGRGGLIDTKALISALKTGKVGAAGLDVYEEEENVFFQDLSDTILQDDVLARLMTFPNVLITAHQAFLTKEALHNIVETTLQNIKEFEQGSSLSNEINL